MSLRSSDAEHVLVTAAVIVSGNRVLLTRRASGTLAGSWEFPGGKVEEGETEPQCLELPETKFAKISCKPNPRPRERAATSHWMEDQPMPNKVKA